MGFLSEDTHLTPSMKYVILQTVTWNYDGNWCAFWDCPGGTSETWTVIAFCLHTAEKCFLQADLLWCANAFVQKQLKTI